MFAWLYLQRTSCLCALVQASTWRLDFGNMACGFACDSRNSMVTKEIHRTAPARSSFRVIGSSLELGSALRSATRTMTRFLGKPIIERTSVAVYGWSSLMIKWPTLSNDTHQFIVCCHQWKTNELINASSWIQTLHACPARDGSSSVAIDKSRGKPLMLYPKGSMQFLVTVVSVSPSAGEQTEPISSTYIMLRECKGQSRPR